ncbi:hypothetical protein EAI_07275 [Harpegnathos saltator]|uniref:Uncharacterized protein n=1 Tax=Harpegnathos saltator TaxID=610380 RepID=E2BN70_HARSA|nr:hypothetical protein EAI_07275 [Harpegnathos saltator]
MQALDDHYRNRPLLAAASPPPNEAVVRDYGTGSIRNSSLDKSDKVGNGALRLLRSVAAGKMDPVRLLDQTCNGS